MSWGDLAAIAGIAVVGLVVGSYAVRTVWLLHGRWKIRKAGPRLLWVEAHRLWREPPESRARDLRDGPGGPDFRPAPPFDFVEEHLSGSQPCVGIRDARGRVWRVKWGHEARPEALAVRVAWACGYFAEVTHFVPEGRISGAGQLSRAGECVAGDGTFRDARFELEDHTVRMLFNEHSWAWDDNPFLGTRELSGLKMVVMLVSNWDTKDRRDVSRGSNTAIFEHRDRFWGHEARYLITDWGAGMGKWGANVVSRSRWDVAGFESQTAHFVTGVRDGFVQFGYQGQRTPDVARGITPAHARWFYRYARRLTEPALHDALLECGATPEEAPRFARALVDRIRQIGEASRG